ncbi:MAG: hypothetical protein ABR878_01615 [Roseiarcus sp.]
MKTMAERAAFVVIADDANTSFNGKLNLSGIYTQDLAIPAEPFLANQLLFVFHLETDVTDPFKKLEVEITFPGEQPRRTVVPLPPFPAAPPERTRQTITLTIPCIYVQLRLGKIDVKVTHEKGTINVVAPWITQLQPPANVS